MLSIAGVLNSSRPPVSRVPSLNLDDNFAVPIWLFRRSPFLLSLNITFHVENCILAPSGLPASQTWLENRPFSNLVR